MAELIVCYLTTKVGSWNVRVDKRHGQEVHHQEHVHISRSGLKGEYSWNKDGTRHDKHRFPASEQQIGRARRIAADALGVPHNTLQFITSINGGSHVSMSEVRSEGRPHGLLSMYVRVSEHLVLLGSQSGLLLFIRDEA